MHATNYERYYNSNADNDSEGIQEEINKQVIGNDSFVWLFVARSMITRLWIWMGTRTVQDAGWEFFSTSDLHVLLLFLEEEL